MFLIGWFTWFHISLGHSTYVYDTVIYSIATALYLGKDFIFSDQLEIMTSAE